MVYLFLLLFPLTVFADCDLVRDLLIVESINQKIEERPPVYFNNFLQGGYINMPSARMGCAGELGAGYSIVPPYRTYNLRLQLYDRIEISGNYRIFQGVDDPHLSQSGFGDLSDKGVNLKCALLLPEETNFVLPGFAIGWDDFLGTKSFQAVYLAATQVFPKINAEATLGFGQKRIRKWFAAAAWLPFANSCHLFSTLQLVAEYDATGYKSKKWEKHPKGHDQNSKLNFGVKQRFFNLIDLQASYVRGRTFAFSGSINYNLGQTQGILPKICNPPLYHTPVITEPIGELRTKEMLISDLYFSLRCQGFEMMETAIDQVPCGKVLYLRVINLQWRYEWTVRERLSYLLANLAPCDIDTIVVIIDGPGFPLQQYTFQMPFLRRFAEGKMCAYEMKVIAPLQNSNPIPQQAENLFFQKRGMFCFSLLPKMISFFGSSTGKFKYALGAYAGVEGYLLNNIWYSIQLSYNFSSNLESLKDVDRLNPSQLINVRTDLVSYLKQKDLIVEEAFLEKNWNLCRGYFAKLSGGIFELMYGGVGGEVLYYPVNSLWAFGIDGAWLKKRKYSGIGFTNKIRKLHGYVPTWVRFHGAQVFLNSYYHFPSLDADFRVKVGKFLANDWGARFEMSHYYPSGMRVYFWYTATNGHDKVNGHTYYDKGVGISIPLDIFRKQSCKSCWSYGMGAWLRDVGQMAYTGSELYYIIRSEREPCLNNSRNF